MAPQRLSRLVHGCVADVVAHSESSLSVVPVGPPSSLSFEECNIAIRDWMYSSLSSTMADSSRWFRRVSSRFLLEISVPMQCLHRKVPSRSGSITQSSAVPSCRLPDMVGLVCTPRPKFGGPTCWGGFTRVQHDLQLYCPFDDTPELDPLHEDIDAAKDDLYFAKSSIR